MLSLDLEGFDNYTNGLWKPGELETSRQGNFEQDTTGTEHERCSKGDPWEANQILEMLEIFPWLCAIITVPTENMYDPMK